MSDQPDVPPASMNLMSPVQRPDEVFLFGKKKKKEKRDYTQLVITDTSAGECLSL